MANEQAVIFDMDGVLVNSYQTHLQAWQATAQSHGLSLTDADFARTFGRTSRDLISMLWPGRYNVQEALDFDLEKEAAYRRLLEKDFPEMDGASELIGSLQVHGFRLAIGSSGPPENVDVVQRCIPNGRYFTATVNGTEVNRGKPDPQVFLLAAEKLGVPPARCAVVEDAPVGVEAARRAGMTSIGLLGTAPRAALEKHAHLVVGSLRDLSPQLIETKIRGAK